MEREVIFKKNRGKRNSNYLAMPSLPLRKAEEIIPQSLLRQDLELPCLGEREVVRHYINLSRLNFSLDANFYPLGSCTMKYNPKINEEMAGLEGFRDIHPYQKDDCLQGALEVIYNLEKILCEITGMKKFTLQPASGAQGELTGMLMIRKYHAISGSKKTKVIIPDSSHGTNPATASMCGYSTVVAESTKDGLVDLDKLNSLADKDVAAIMLTNPNTLGLFEENILKISDIIHKRGGLLYYDGANFNPLLGITKPSLMGFDVVHLNLHKTFSAPHGCGGPGAGAVGVNDKLVDFLPLPLVERKDSKFYFNYNVKHSLGRVRSFYGNFLVALKAYVYLLRLGREGLLRAAHNSTLNANYLREKLKDYYETFPKRCMHEVVFSCQRQKERGASCLDIAKRLLDYNIHPPTMYFPLTVKEALMVEPTETEGKETLDYYIEAMIKINREVEEELQKVKSAPHTMPVKRVDEVKAARYPELRWPAPLKRAINPANEQR